MNTEMVQIRSVKQYFKDFVQENAKIIDNPMRRAQIKLQILDSFRREIFEQIVFSLKLDPGTMDLDAIAELDTVRNILHNSFRKWKRLCMICNDAGLVNWLAIEDLKQVLEESQEDIPDGTVSGGDFDGDEALKVAEPATSGYLEIIDEPEEAPEKFEPIKDEEGNLVPQEFPAGYWTGGRT